jgi:ribosomal protein L40E
MHTTMACLFADLPVQEPPSRIEAGRLAIEWCPDCGARIPRRARKDCGRCGGGGWVLADPVPQAVRRTTCPAA